MHECSPAKRSAAGKYWLDVGDLQTKKKPVLAYELFLKYGGEAGIRTPDTLPYTHFPGVLLQPLGHLTKVCDSNQKKASCQVVTA